MADDDELRIQRRPPRAATPPVYTRVVLDDVRVSLDELTQIDTIVRQYIAESPGPSSDFREDERKVKVEADTAILPDIKLARLLKREELGKLAITGSLNNYLHFTVHFDTGGRIYIDYPSGDDAGKTAVETIKDVIRYSHNKLSYDQWTRVAQFFVWFPVAFFFGYVFWAVAGGVPPWFAVGVVFPIQIASFIAHGRILKVQDVPTVRNRSQQEIEDARRIPRSSVLGLILTSISIVIAVVALATR